MDILDVIIIIIMLHFIFWHKKISFTYYFTYSIGIISGYLLGLILAINITKDMTSDDEIGTMALCLMFGLAIFFELIIFVIRKNINIQVTNYNFLRIDRLLAVPYKIIYYLVFIFLLSQTLLYIPISWVQFSAQGSGFIMAFARVFPDTYISKTAMKLSPNQFVKLQLPFDPGPIKNIDTSHAGDFKSIVDKIAPSIVRITTSRCIGTQNVAGSGSVIAPGLVITNQHVINGSSAIYIVDHNGTYPATPVVIDEDHDIAVIYSRFINLPPIPISDKAVAINTKAMSLGYPGANDQNFSMVIATTGNNQLASWHNKLNSSNTFSLSQGLGAGSSGGPVIDLNGEIIGINDAGSGNDLIAIKADIAKRAVETAKRQLYPAFSQICAYDRSAY